MAVEILFLCQRVPFPPDRGDRITTYHVLKMLRGMGRVRVGCFLESPRDREGVKSLEEMDVEVEAVPLHPRLKRVLSLAWLPTRIPLTLPYFHSGRLEEAVRRWCAQGLDLGFAYSSSMGQYLLGRPIPLKVMQFAELDSDKWRQLSRETTFPRSWIFKREAELLERFERSLARAVDLSLVVSPLEKALFQERIPGVEPLIVENGVDAEYFHPETGSPREEAVIFTGVMNYDPNVQGVLRFARQVWPLVRKTRPKARFFVVGSDPVRSIQALHGKEGIHVTGRVPDTRPWFDRARVAAAPLWVARGIQNKVLEAMAMALPVVATPAAFGGIDARPGEHLLLAEEPGDFARAVVELLENPEKAASMGRAARAWVKERYSWKNILAGLEKILRKKLEATSPGPSSPAPGASTPAPGPGGDGPQG